VKSTLWGIGVAVLGLVVLLSLLFASIR